MTSNNEIPLVSDRQRLRCFIIGPIGSRLAEVGTDARIKYEEAIQVVEEVIVPACKAVGLDPVRADGLTRAGEITEQVFRRLRDDDVVIADLTDANANVMYELGLRHTRKALTVQVGEYSRLPFDVNVIRTVQFSRSQYGLITARDELIQILETGLTGEYDWVSATRVWNEHEAEESEDRTSEDRPEEPALTDPPGFMDLIAESEDNQHTLSEAMQAITELMAELGRAAEAATAEIAQSDARGAGMRGRLAVAARYASNVDTIADQLEPEVERYRSAMDAVSAGTLAIIERLESDPEELSEGVDYGRMLRQLAARSRESLENQGAFLAALREASKGARVMRQPTQRVISAFDQFASSTQAIDEWDRRLQALGVDVPPPDWEYPDQDSA